MTTASPGVLTEAAPQKTLLVVGNPNCGKTTLFNALTGSRYKVANYPGVTVEYKKATLQLKDPTSSEYKNLSLIDLPGMYALATHALDERVAAEILLGLHSTITSFDGILFVADASNLERNLYLLSQILDIGVPCVVALTMKDIALRSGVRVREELLSRLLGCPVIGIHAGKKEGIDALLQSLQTITSEPVSSSPSFTWAKDHAALLEQAEREGVTFSSSRSHTRGQKILLGLGIHSGAIKLPEAPSHAPSFSSSEEAQLRYQWAQETTAAVIRTKPVQQHWSSWFDSILTHKIWGTVSFLVIMGLLFQSVFSLAAYPMDLIDGLMGSMGDLLREQLPESLIRSLLVDGIIGGAGSVLVFLPQIVILFFLLSLLEDSGYLARAAVVSDALLRRVGLQGRAFVPLMSSFACAVPGIMAARTIPSFGERLLTIMIAPLMSCSARLPVYSVIIAAFIPERYVAGVFSLQGFTLFALYLLGIVGAIIIAWIVRIFLMKGTSGYFIMELPPLRVPSPLLGIRTAYDKGVLFLKSAGTTILAMSVLVWALVTFPGPTIKESYAGKLGEAIEPVAQPLGFDWQMSVSIITSFAAREVFVSSLATLYNAEGADESNSLVDELSKRRQEGSLTFPTALSLLVFYVFACQCLSTLAIAKRETGSWKWAILMFGYMTVTAYGLAFVTYQTARWYGG